MYLHVVNMYKYLHRIQTCWYVSLFIEIRGWHVKPNTRHLKGTQKMAGDDPETSNFCGKKMESFEETSEVSVQFLAGFLYHLWFINCVEHLFYWKSFDESLLWIPEDKNPYFRMSWIGLCNLRRNWWTSWSLLLLLGGVHVGPASWVTSAENPQAILSLSEFVASLNTCLVHIIVQFPRTQWYKQVVTTWISQRWCCGRWKSP